MSGTILAKDYRSSNIEVLPSQAYILVGETRERETENKYTYNMSGEGLSQGEKK